VIGIAGARGCAGRVPHRFDAAANGQNRERPMHERVPSLTVTEHGSLVRVHLGGLARGEGRTLQEAGDDLIGRLLGLAMAFRSTGFTSNSEVMPDLETMTFLYELGEFVAAGGDIRARVFG
jgi:hypothetical protein